MQTDNPQDRPGIRRPGVSAEPFKEEDPSAIGPSARRSSSVVMSNPRASVTIDNTTVIAFYDKPPEALAIIQLATKCNPLFEPLSEEQKRIVYGAMIDEWYDAGENVINEGERGDLFYVVETGAFEAHIAARGEEAVAKYESGTCFGELALLYNSARAATVKCTREGRLWAIDRGVFNMIMVASNKAVFTRAQEFLKSTTLLESCSSAQIDFLATMFEEYSYSVGECLWEEEEPIEVHAPHTLPKFSAAFCGQGAYICSSRAWH